MQIVQAIGQTKDGHDFRGHGDVEAILSGIAVARAAERDHDVAQRAVIHVHHTPPVDPAGINTQVVAPVNVVIQHGREQIIGRANGMEVAGKVQINIFHGHDLRITAASGATFHTKARAQGRFAQTDRGLFADAVETVAKSHRSGGFALPSRRWSDGGNQN